MLNDKDYENTLDLSSIGRNLFTNELLVKRYYSLLGKNEQVNIMIINDRKFVLSNKISHFDYCLLHPVTVYEQSVSMYQYVYKYRELFSGILYIWSLVIRRRDRKCNENELEFLEDKTIAIDQFAKAKEFKVIFILCGFSRQYIEELNNKYPCIELGGK